MLKEANRAFGQIYLGIDQELRDRLAAKYAEYFLQFGPRNGLKTPKARVSLEAIFNRLVEGKRVPFSAFAERVLDGFDIKTEGLDNLNLNNGGVFVANHPSDGPLRGGWTVLALNNVVAKKRKFQGNYENIWVQSSVPENQVYGLAPLHIQRVRVAHLIENSGCVLTFKSINNQKSFQTANDHLNSGGFLGIYPEGKASKTLTRAKWKTARFLQKLTNWQTPIIPVAFWPDDNNLNIRFGKPFNNEKLLEGGEFQKTSDRLMIAIAKLLPEEKRGIYQAVFNKKF